MPLKDPEERKKYNKLQYLKRKEYQKEYREKNKDKLKEYNKEYRQSNEEELKEKKKEYIEQNKEIVKERKKDWYENNKNTKIKEYREQNREKMKEYNKEWYDKNKCEHGRDKTTCKICGGSRICQHDKIRSTCKDCGGASICKHSRTKSKCKECGGGSFCEHDKRKSACKICSPLLCLVALQRSHIWRVMKQSDLSKTKPTIEYLGCSVEYFQNYIKSKFVDDMTFDNIQYDHIKPVSKFNLDDEDELLSCCHYSNFQPLLTTTNLEKSNKWSKEDEVFWKDNICNKEYTQLYLPK